MNSSQSSQHHPTYRSPFLSPLTPPAAGGVGGGGGFGRNNHSHPYSPSSFRPQQRTPRFYNVGETPTSAAAAAATTCTPEWNAQHVHVDLQTAGQILLQRQLKCSAKFIAELDIGLCLDNQISNEDGNDYDIEYKSTTIPEDLFLPTHHHHHSKIQYPSLFQYARTLLEMGDYAYAATILSVPASSSRTTSSSEFSKSTSAPSSLLSPTVEIATNRSRHSFPHKPLPNLSSYETYLRSYALYMAGEKQKEEQILEYQRCAFEFILPFQPVRPMNAHIHSYFYSSFI